MYDNVTCDKSTRDNVTYNHVTCDNMTYNNVTCDNDMCDAIWIFWLRK